MREEFYDRWVNMQHGMELDPDINKGKRNNENGILYLAEYIMCLHKEADIVTYDKLVFEQIVSNLRYQDAGVYNRGEGESTSAHVNFVPAESRRSISHDNITGISCASYLLGNKEECKAIANHGLKNFFVFNNIKPLFSFPFNPGNIAPWLALGGHELLALVFLPFFIINFLITMCKGKQDTSSKKLYILTLYTLRDVFGFGWLNTLLIKRMESQYGGGYLHEIYSIYYTNVNHPLREITK